MHALLSITQPCNQSGAQLVGRLTLVHVPHDGDAAARIISQQQEHAQLHRSAVEQGAAVKKSGGENNPGRRSSPCPQCGSVDSGPRSWRRHSTVLKGIAVDHTGLTRSDTMLLDLGIFAVKDWDETETWARTCEKFLDGSYSLLRLLFLLSFVHLTF
jgi:hypothetical protein